MPHGLGIDVGTSNVKVALVDENGALIGSAGRPLTTLRDGASAEQDADAMWAAVVDAVQEVVTTDVAVGGVAAIGVCSQYSSIVPVTGDGRALAPFVMHMDRRGTERSFAILGAHEDAFATWIERHGIPPVGHGLSLGHVLWFQHERPELHDATTAYLEPMDFVNLRLTGRVTATQCTQFTTQLCDNRSLAVADYDPTLMELSGVDADKLPPLVGPDAVIGPVLDDVAERLGIGRDAVVVAGMNDSHAGALATGAYGAGRAGLMVGTTAVVLDDVDRFAVDLDHELVSMPSPVPGRYLVWAENGIAGRAVEHVLDQVLAVPGGFDGLEATLGATPPGSNGVLFLPWLDGSMAPRGAGKMRGGFLNLSVDTTQADLVRALVEGTAFNVGWLLPAVEAFTDRRIDEVVFGGGAARSAGWAQVLADVLGRPVSVLQSPSAAAARAVAAAALGIDVQPDIAATCEPDPASRDLYGFLQEQFQAAFEAVRPISEAVGAKLNP